MHIFGIELTPGKNCLKIGGLHHDLKGFLEKNDLIKLININRQAGGFYKAELVVNGIRVLPPTTFFPKNWSQEQVLRNIAEAYNNSMKQGIIPVLKNNGNYTLEGLTNENVLIRMYINSRGTIVSAYPLLK